MPHATELVLSFQTDPDPVQAAFLRRAMSALERITAITPAKALTAALAAPTGAGTLAQILIIPSLSGRPWRILDPMVRARTQCRASEHVVPACGRRPIREEAGKIAGITRQAIDKRRRSNAILAVREGSDWKYPGCQFRDGEVLPGIAEVVRDLRPGAGDARFPLLAPDSALGGRSPLEALRQGDLAAVERASGGANVGDGFA